MDLEGKHLWQQDRSHAHRWNYLSSFFMHVLMYLLRFFSKRKIVQREKSRVGAALSVSSCSLLLPTHTPAQPVIMYHKLCFDISLFHSVRWNVLLLFLLLFVLFGIPKYWSKGIGESDN